MPAPYPRRGPSQAVARAVNRGSKGMAGGKFSGVSAVRKGEAGKIVTPPPTGGGVIASASFRDARSSWAPGAGGSKIHGDTVELTHGSYATYCTYDGAIEGMRIHVAGWYSFWATARMDTMTAGQFGQMEMLTSLAISLRVWNYAPATEPNLYVTAPPHWLELNDYVNITIYATTGNVWIAKNGFAHYSDASV